MKVASSATCGTTRGTESNPKKKIGNSPSYADSDAHPDALSRYLTHGGRAIPIAIVLDEQGRELGAWGPRPAPLQAELRKKLREEGSPGEDDKGEFYAPIMAWYAKDGGRTVAQEVLMFLERGGQDR